MVASASNGMATSDCVLESELMMDPRVVSDAPNPIETPATSASGLPTRQHEQLDAGNDAEPRRQCRRITAQNPAAASRMAAGSGTVGAAGRFAAVALPAAVAPKFACQK